jgi:hypothetical protein
MVVIQQFHYFLLIQGLFTFKSILKTKGDLLNLIMFRQQHTFF